MTKEANMRGRGNWLWLAAALVAMSLWPGVALAASTITGAVNFDGKPPVLRPIAMDAEPVCAKKHAGHPVQAQMLDLGTRHTISNVMVFVSKGVPAGKTYPAPKDPVTVDQDGCM